MSPTETRSPPPEEQAGQTMSVVEALTMAMTIHREGRYLEAGAIYRQILAAIPDCVDALAFLGVAEHQAGRTERALEHLDRALTLEPDHVDALSNRGSVHRSLRHLDRAEADYRRALELRPDDTVTLGNLGTVLRARGDLEGAVAMYRAVLARKSDQASTWQNLASALDALKRGAEAVEAYREAARLSPQSASMFFDFGIALCMQGHFDEATEMYRRCLALEPGHPRARHLLAACTGEGAPARASDDYVRAEFDSFADKFDEILANLEYRGPEIVGQAVEEIASQLPPQASVLDAGCGTGLCVPHLRALASRLVGVDLSAGMVELARKRGGYDELVVDELTAYLRHHARAYDLVVSADTLVYFGDLTEVIGAAAGSLRPGGFVIVTLERFEPREAEADFRLQNHGRYCHTRSYVSRVLQQAGFVDVVIGEISSRKEVEKPVPGFVVRGRLAVT
jgi:predicted TPR repeat methyltransferase